MALDDHTKIAKGLDGLRQDLTEAAQEVREADVSPRQVLGLAARF